MLQLCRHGTGWLASMPVDRDVERRTLAGVAVKAQDDVAGGGVWRAADDVEARGAGKELEQSAEWLERRAERTAKAVKAVVYVVCWAVSSNSLILLNRHIMVDLHFEFPVLLSSMGMAFSYLMAVLARQVNAQWCPARSDITFTFVVHNLLLISFLSFLTLVLGQIPYFTLTVSFIQMLKSFTPVVTLVVMLGFGLEEPKTSLICSVLVIALSTSVASASEVNFDGFGFAVFMLCTLAEATKMAMTQKLLQGKSFSPMQSLYYICPWTLAFLMLGVVLVEAPGLATAASVMRAHPLTFVLAASLGFCINLFTMGVVKTLSGLWLKVLVQVKGLVLVLTSVAVNGDQITRVQFVSYLCAICGFMWYSRVKMQASSSQKRAVAPSEKQ